MPLILQGRPVISTSAIPTDGGVGENESYCALGDFESLVLAFPRKYRVAVDPRSRFLANDLRVLMALNFGVVIADPSAFEIVSACTE
jgi:hypothetical protein